MISFFACYRHYHGVFSIFLFIYAVGFATIGWMSRPRRQVTLKTPAASVTPLLQREVASTESAGSV